MFWTLDQSMFMDCMTMNKHVTYVSELVCTNVKTAHSEFAQQGSSDVPLRAYLKRIRKYPTFSPEQEMAAAIELRTARRERWIALLCYPPLVSAILELVRARLELGDEHGVDELLDLDVDGELAELLIADIERLANNQSDGLTLAVRHYLGDCRNAQRRVRRLTDEFAKANLRLVVNLARRFAHARLSLSDLVQEGNIGLLKAVERFDPRRGVRFATYASWWIRHSISRAIYNKGRQVRLPIHVNEAHYKLSRARALFLTQKGREPSVEELARGTGIPVDKVEKTTRLQLVPTFFDDDAAIDRLEDERSATPDGELEAQQIGLGLEDALASLRPMEADIVRRRFGLDGGRPETLREIAEHYALSRERIRQLQERAVGRVRAELSRMQLI
jgi:RNA polymerase primary sigma factor